MEVRRLRVKGMHCSACELLIGEVLVEGGIARSVKARWKSREVEIEADWTDEKKIVDESNVALAPMGYRILEPGEKDATVVRETIVSLAIAAGVLALLFLVESLGVRTTFTENRLDPAGAFVLGLIASVSTCFALVGGLLLTYSAQMAQKTKGELVAGVWLFHLARLVGFFLLGGLLGLVGESLQLDYTATIVLLAVASLVMIAFGLQLLNLLPAFSWGKRTGERLSSLARSAGVGAGALLGVATFFLPCGFTQSVQIQAMASTSFWDAATMTFVFALGTFPVLALASFSFVRGMRSRWSAILSRAAGAIVLVLGAYQLWNTLVGLGIVAPIERSF